MIKISVLVPVYNVEQYIERCLNSLFGQDYENLEFIFVDDCTPDNSIELINKCLQYYPNRQKQVRVLSHDINKGSGAARKTALEAASGDYVMWVDSDDWLEPNAISSFAAKAESDNADIVIANHYYAYSDRRIAKQITDTNSKTHLLKRLLTREGKFPVCLWNKLIRRELHLKAMPEEGLNYGEDFAIIPILVYLSNKISYINQYLYNYWQGNPNSYIKNFSQASFNNIIQATNILYQFFIPHKNIVTEQTLNLMLIRTKLLLIGNGNKIQKKAAINLWKNLNNVTGLSTTEKIILKLADFKAFDLIDFILSSGVKTKRILSKLRPKR